MAGRSLECLEHSLGRVALHFLAVDDYLDDSIPDLLRHIIACDAYKIENDIDVPERKKGQLVRCHLWTLSLSLSDCLPGVISGVFLGKNGHLEHHLLAYGIVSRLKIVEHFLHNFFGITAIAHGIEQINGHLAH